MKKKVFVVQGKARSGKGQTVRHACDELEKLKGVKRSYYAPDQNGRDYRVVLNLNGVKVGINTNNHPIGQTSRSLKQFLRKKCDFVILPVLTSGESVDAVNQRSKKLEIEWIPLKSARQPNGRSKAQARKHLVRTVSPLLKK